MGCDTTNYYIMAKDFPPFEVGLYDGIYCRWRFVSVILMVERKLYRKQPNTPCLGLGCHKS